MTALISLISDGPIWVLIIMRKKNSIFRTVFEAVCFGNFFGTHKVNHEWCKDFSDKMVHPGIGSNVGPSTNDQGRRDAGAWCAETKVYPSKLAFIGSLIFFPSLVIILVWRPRLKL